MDPLGGAASIVALATVSKSIIDSGRKYVKDVRDAPLVMSRFCNELEALTVLFDRLLILQSTTSQDVLFCRPGALTEILRRAPLLKDFESQLQKIEARIKELSLQNTRKRLMFPLRKHQILEGLDVVDRIRSILDTALLVDERSNTHSIYGDVQKVRVAFETNQKQMLLNDSKNEVMHNEVMALLNDVHSRPQLGPVHRIASTQRVRGPRYLHTQGRRIFSRTMTNSLLDFSFGSLFMWNKKMVEPINFDQSSRGKKHSRLTAVFFPSPMFWQTLIRFQFEWAARVDSFTAPMFSLQYLDIVQDDHPVIKASRHGDLSALEDALFHRNSSPSCSTADGWIPLHFAAAYGQTDTCRLLIEEGAPLDATGIRGLTPLHVAAHFGHFEIFRVLLKAGSDPDEYHDHGMNAVIEICSNERVSNSPELTEFLKWLLLGQDHFFLDIHARDNSKRTILYDLAYPLSWTGLSPQALTSDQIEAIKTVLRQGGKGDELDIHGDTILHGACGDNRLDLVKLLLTGGCDINVRDRLGVSPLYYAIKNENLELVTTLVEHGSDVNACCDFNITLPTGSAWQTPLSLAAASDRVDIVQFLIESGAGYCHENVANAFYAAISQGSHKMVGHFIENISKQWNLCGTVGLAVDSPSNVSVLIDMLHKAGASLDDEDRSDHTPLTKAAMFGYDDVVHQLIELGADVDKLSRNQTPLTPLGWAARDGQGKIVNILLA